MTPPLWTPEEIAALVEGFAGEETRRRVEQALATDPEARRWHAELLADRESLRGEIAGRIALVPVERFTRQVMRRVTPAPSPAPRSGPAMGLLASWRGLLLAAALMTTAVMIGVPAFRRVLPPSPPNPDSLPAGSAMSDLALGCLVDQIFLEITVVDAAGRPVPEADVWLTPALPAVSGEAPVVVVEPAEPLSGRTDARGVVQIPSTMQMIFDVEARAAGHRPARSRVDTRLAHAGVVSQRITLE